MNWFSKIHGLAGQEYERYLPSAFDGSLTLLEKVNKVIETLNQIVLGVNTVADYVDGHVDTQNEKIKQLRDDFEVLKDWLENEGLEERTEQVLNEWFDNGRLAQIINSDVFNMKADKATFEQFVLSTTAQLQQKADQAFVDSQFATIVGGAPKGTYDDLTSLQNAYPSGAEGIFLVLADGHWYYWNNTTLAWTDGGVYQATSIGEGDVGVKEINWLVNNYRLNLFDGKYRQGSVRAGTPFYLEGTTSALNKMAVVTVKPNTRYYVLRSLPSRCNIATATKSIAEGENFDGAVGLNYSGTGVSDYPAYIAFTTGGNDKYAYISMSVDGTEPYLCISEEPPANNKRYYFNQPNNAIDVHNQTNLLQPYNLFNGEYETGLQIQGAEPFLYNERTGGKVGVVPVKPNTAYTLMRETPSRLNWGTTSKLLAVGEELDGSIRRNDSGSGTTDEPKLINFTTGSDDKFLYFNTSVANTEPIVKVVEGTVTDLGLLNYYEKKLDNSFKGWLSDYINGETQNNGIHVVKSGERVDIVYTAENGNQIIYDFGRNTNANIQLDTWRLISIYFVDGKTGTKHLITEGDNEGVLKIAGEADYIGGVHGDELSTSVKIFVDGIETTGDFDKKVSSVEFVVYSDIFRADTTVKAFTKVKNIVFSMSGVQIKNKWTPLSTYQLEHVRGGILSIYKKTNDNQELIKTFKTNMADDFTTVPPEGTTITMPNDIEISSATLIGGLVTAKLRSIKRGGNGNMGSITDFGTRLKIYIDSYTGETVNPDTEIYEEHEFLVSADGIPFDGNWSVFDDSQEFGMLDKRLEEIEADIKLKANKQQEDWIMPTMLNGWTHETLSTGLMFRKNDFDQLEFKGTITGGEENTIAFILPSGYIPQKTRYVLVVSTLSFGVVYFNFSGSVLIRVKGTGTSRVSFDNVIINL